MRAWLNHQGKLTVNPVQSFRPAPARDKLLEAGVKLVRQQGFAGTSIDQLCLEAGVTKGAFCHHFASKEALGVAPAESFSCVAGTMVQEAFLSSEPIRAACNSSILGNAAALEDDLAAAIDQSGASGVTAASLARHIQAVIQGAFVLAKAGGDAGAAAAAREHLPHLRRYFEMLLTNENTRAD